MTTTHGNPTDIPDPNGSAHARLNWLKNRNDELQDENAKPREGLEEIEAHLYGEVDLGRVRGMAKDILSNVPHHQQPEAKP